MKFAIQCKLAPESQEKRISLRLEHLRYIEANQNRIFCGGPTIDHHGNPEMMLIIIDTPDLASAEAFIQAEPYHQAGVFEQVSVRLWKQVLPESEPGELLHEIRNRN